MESGACYSKGKYHHAKKDGNNGQGIVGFGGLVSPAGYLSVEVRDGNGSVVCNLEVVSTKEDICQKSTIGRHKESPDCMGQYIWSWSVGNAGHHFCKGRVKISQRPCVLLRGCGLEI